MSVCLSVFVCLSVSAWLSVYLSVSVSIRLPLSLFSLSLALSLFLSLSLSLSLSHPPHFTFGCIWHKKVPGCHPCLVPDARILPRTLLTLSKLNKYTHLSFFSQFFFLALLLSFALQLIHKMKVGTRKSYTLTGQNGCIDFFLGFMAEAERGVRYLYSCFIHWLAHNYRW